MTIHDRTRLIVPLALIEHYGEVPFEGLPAIFSNTDLSKKFFETLLPGLSHFQTRKQLPPTNSRTIELLGRLSLLTPRK